MSSKSVWQWLSLFPIPDSVWKGNGIKAYLAATYSGNWEQQIADFFFATGIRSEEKTRCGVYWGNIIYQKKILRNAGMIITPRYNSGKSSLRWIIFISSSKLVISSPRAFKDSYFYHFLSFFVSVIDITSRQESNTKLEEEKKERS